MILKYCPHQTLDTGLFLKWMRLMMYMSSLWKNILNDCKWFLLCWYLFVIYLIVPNE
jgi:hypothetical protein